MVDTEPAPGESSNPDGDSETHHTGDTRGGVAGRDHKHHLETKRCKWRIRILKLVHYLVYSINECLIL